MLQAITVHTNHENSIIAGEELGRSIRNWFNGKSPAVVIIFASPVYAYSSLLAALRAQCRPAAVVGCSSAGEFTGEGLSSSSAVAVALSSDDIRFKVHVQRDITTNIREAAFNLAAAFDPDDDPEFPHRAVLMLVDVLAGFAEEFLEAFMKATEGRYGIFGGGAADDAAFRKTFVFADDEALSCAAVALEIKSRRAIGLGVSHGWTHASPPIKVTRANGLIINELDNKPAVEYVEEFARQRGTRFDRRDPLPFFLHHVIGIQTEEGDKLRVPLKVMDDGSIACASEVPTGSTIRIMRTRNESASEAAYIAANRARRAIDSHEPGMALFFDCAATRLRLGEAFGSSISEVKRATSSSVCVGCNTYGQFAGIEGQFSGFHNCTAVVCVLPD
jgi:hypothetical protein